MPFGSHKHKKTVLISAALLALVPMVTCAAVSEQQLADAKDQFNELWHSAAETTKRRATLEQNLASFDSKVANARRDLEKAAADRKNIRLKIDEQQKLVGVLEEQMHAAGETRGFYQAVAASQKEDITSFVRYLVSRDIALRESGPAAGGDVLRHVVRGSLGDNVDAALADSALLRARQKFSLQIGTLVSEAGKAETRLQSVMSELKGQLVALEDESNVLRQSVDEKSAFIDDSWKMKELTEEELKDVAEETQEANARIGLMQTSLLQINTELKEAKIQKLRSELEEHQAKMKSLTDVRDQYLRKDQAMQLLEDAEFKALQQTVQQRNTDKKNYKRTEENSLKLASMKDEYARRIVDASGATLSTPETEDLARDIEDLKAQLVLMRDGVPEDVAADYIHKKRQSAEATAVRKDLAVVISAQAPEITTVQSQINGKLGEIETAENDTSLDGLPPLFSWPVIGSITAPYLDADYVNVFKVPHRGMDIAVPQGTPIRVVSEGIVFAVKDGGATGYSYILVGHRNGYASLYGHVSKSFVKPGDVVGYGHTIGLSGGAPGSHGAGPMTTGSHLHLEMMKDGAHFNPLEVLGR